MVAPLRAICIDDLKKAAEDVAPAITFEEYFEKYMPKNAQRVLRDQAAKEAGTDAGSMSMSDLLNFSAKVRNGKGVCKKATGKLIRWTGGLVDPGQSGHDAFD